jgi:DNA-binding MarR family transcriptional regulator
MIHSPRSAEVGTLPAPARCPRDPDYFSIAKEMSRADLTRGAVEGQRQVMRALLDTTLGDLLETDVTMAQLKALAVIQRQPKCSIGRLSAQLGVGPAAASLLVDKLARSGLAYRVRDPVDGRRVMVQATPDGADLVNRIRQGGHALLENWVGQLADDDLIALNQGVRALAALAGGLALPRHAELADALADHATGER